jgi:hypothetical protein
MNGGGTAMTGISTEKKIDSFRQSAVARSKGLSFYVLQGLLSLAQFLQADF